MKAGKRAHTLPLALALLSLAACGGEEQAQGPCRIYPQVITWENGNEAYYSFDAATNTFSYSSESHLEEETWTYLSKEDFIREAGRPGLGLHVEYERRYMVGVESEQRSYSEDGRLLRSETFISDNGLYSMGIEFDAWDDMNRPLRGFATYWLGTPEEHFYSCTLMQRAYNYDDEKNQVTIETAPGVNAESGEVCQGGVFFDTGILRLTFNEYGLVVRRESWDFGADINVTPPDLDFTPTFQVSAPEAVCL